MSVCAVSGALEARNKQMDVFGAIVVALVTALGGGTIRDLLLQHGPIFWVSDPGPLIAAICTAIAAFTIASSPGRSFRKALLVADAGGLALFTVVGVEKAVGFGAHPVVALMMGVITGVAGGILRDILCNEIPLVLRRDVYATASIAGAGLYLALRSASLPPNAVSLVSILTVFSIRVAVLRWKLALPGALQALPPTNGSPQ